MRFTLLNNCSTLSNDDLWHEFLPVTWHGFELRKTPFKMTMIHDLLRVKMQAAFNRTVYDTKTRSDFYILDYSQMVIPFNPLVFCYCSQYWIFCRMLLTVLGSTIICYDTYLQNLSLIWLSFNPTEIFRNWRLTKKVFRKNVVGVFIICLRTILNFSRHKQ